MKIFILSLPLLFSIPIYLVSLSTNSLLYLLISAVILLSVNIILKYVYNKNLSTISALAITTPLLPMAGAGALQLALILFLIINIKEVSKVKKYFFYFALLPFAFSFFTLFQSDLINQILVNSSINEFIHALRFSPHLAFNQFKEGIAWYSFALFFSYLIHSSEAKSQFWYALSRLGVPLAIIISLIQFLLWNMNSGLVQYFPNQTQLWNEVGRPAGSFSDPNAFGVFLFIFIVILVLNKRNENLTFTVLLVISSLITASLSGSRTLWIGIFIFGLLYLVFKLKKNQKILLQSTLFCLITAAFLMIISSYFEIPSLQRLKESFLGILSGDFSSVMSRMYFAKVNFAVISDYFLIGLGPTTFSLVAPKYASEIGIDLGGWTDNTNNFYLGLITEYGILGSLLIVLEFFRLKPKLEKEIFIPAISAIAVIFFFGPHQQFEEVRIILALLLASLFDPKEIKFQHLIVQLSFILLYLPVIASSSTKTEYGMFNYEAPENGEMFRWTTASFKTFSVCDPDNKSRIKIRNGSPNLQTVELASAALNTQYSYRLKSGESTEIAIECAPKERRAWCGQGIIGKVDPTWIPDVNSEDISRDHRILGVQIYSSTELQARRFCKR